MRYVSTGEMRKIDEKTLVTTGVFSGFREEDRLIKLASLGIADFVLRMTRGSAVLPTIYVVFGNGNNGADAVFAGWELAEQGFRVRYFASISADAAKGVAKMIADSGRCGHIHWWGDHHRWTALPSSAFDSGSVVIDGVLGIGLQGAPTAGAEAAIAWINRMRGRAQIVSVDVPSGLDADSGTHSGAVVQADFTVTMGLPKAGMRFSSTLALTGSIYVNDLEIASEILESGQKVNTEELVSLHDVAACIPKRKWDSHKGDFGHVCIVGGANGYCGAPALAARGALRTGAGLVSAFVPSAIQPIVATQAPELMAWPLPGDAVSAESLRKSGFDFSNKTLVVGPGMSQVSGVREAVIWLLQDSGASGAVIDADGLNAFSGVAGELSKFKFPKIITPHPGEASRLLGVSVRSIQSDREGALKKLVELTGAAVILKGAGTLVSAPGRGVHLVPGVNPGMARGGMGDALSGIAGALLARGLEAFDAARAAAWIHSAAGDQAAWRKGREAMLATDLIDSLADIMRLFA